MRRLAVVTIALVLQACNAEPAAEMGTVSGVVNLGPIMPVCQVGVPCDGVYKGAKVVLRIPGGQAVKRATADDNGAFQLDAPAGSYEVAVEVEGPLPRCTSVPVAVKARETVKAVVDCDSGIR
jgi:hypothetical protein